MVGFSMGHLHPGFFILGALSMIVLVAWLLPAFIFVVRAKSKVAAYTYWMIAGSLFVFAGMVLPDNVGLLFRR